MKSNYWRIILNCHSPNAVSGKAAAGDDRLLHKLVVFLDTIFTFKFSWNGNWNDKEKTSDQIRLNTIMMTNDCCLHSA